MVRLADNLEPLCALRVVGVCCYFSLNNRHFNCDSNIAPLAFN